jgi:NADPH-dependent glutamate synthase beta subunit-like oxidoreductase
MVKVARMQRMSDQHQLRVAVIGSGPAGIYTAEALVKQAPSVRVDVLDRLPTPYGLVRYGVAPDHPSIKSIARYLQRVLEHPSVRFLGCVEFGKDVSREELLECYDAVVYATGAMVDRRLGIPGEDLPGSVAATDFVNWYCGHPDAAEYSFDLSAESVAVLGIGNVAVDVARILARQADELSPTDTPEPVLRALEQARVRDIYMIGRRGPVQAKFTTKELRELGKLPSAGVWVDPADMELDPAAAKLAEAERRIRGNVKVMSEWAERPAPADTGGAGPRRRIELRFWRRPVEIVGDGRVEGLRLERTRLDADGRVVGTGEYETLPVGLVLRSVGYQSVPLPGVPFDERSRVVPNEAGRIHDDDGRLRQREYVAGWLKRGPTGVIGTNKSDAAETVESLLDDVTAGGRPGIEALLEARGIGVVTYDGWLAIDARETELARTLGRGERVKLVGWDALREACRT